ncbi:hypothetical protein K1719_037248 [Acacia pycnantha]|nr:hypothetical protein K1719_037248 [Acacia pycnantha]
MSDNTSKDNYKYLAYLSINLLQVYCIRRIIENTKNTSFKAKSIIVYGQAQKSPIYVHPDFATTEGGFSAQFACLLIIFHSATTFLHHSYFGSNWWLTNSSQLLVASCIVQ